MLIGCIVQARLGSSRLPGKVLLNLDENNPTLFYVIEQLKNCKKIDKIIIATTNNKEDNLIDDFTKKIGIICFRGNEKNVLDRYYNCAKKFGFDIIVRVTADCPLIDPETVDLIIDSFNPKNEDYTSNTLKNTFPKGTDVEVFTFRSLEKTWKEAKLPSEKEHVTPYIRKSKKFKLKNFENTKNLSKYRWTLDRKEDLKLIREILKRIEKRPILTKDILSVLEKEPDLCKINQNIDPHEGINKSILEDRDFMEKRKKNETN